MVVYTNEAMIIDDAVILSAIWMCRGLDAEGGLDGLISTIDYIDHAVHLYEDISDVLNRLQQIGIVAYIGGSYRLHESWLPDPKDYQRSINVQKLINYYKSRLSEFSAEAPPAAIEHSDLFQPSVRVLPAEEYNQACRKYLDAHKII